MDCMEGARESQFQAPQWLSLQTLSDSTTLKGQRIYLSWEEEAYCQIPKEVRNFSGGVKQTVHRVGEEGDNR